MFYRILMIATLSLGLFSFSLAQTFVPSQAPALQKQTQFFGYVYEHAERRDDRGTATAGAKVYDMWIPSGNGSTNWKVVHLVVADGFSMHSYKNRYGYVQGHYGIRGSEEFLYVTSAYIPQSSLRR
jgi:hypothetical protein